MHVAKQCHIRASVVCVGLGLLWAAVVVTARAEDLPLEPLQTVLPRPVFSGTPRFIVSPNLERVTGKLRAPFLVPLGTINLAAGRPVTGSDPKPFVGRYSMITDGDKDGDGESFVELNPGKQWVQIDLGRRCRILAVVVWHYHGEARVYHDMVVRLGSEPRMTAGVVTVFNNDHDNSSALGVGKDKEYIDTFEGRLIPVTGPHARYVRLYSNGNTTDDMNDYVEVEVWGAASASVPSAGKGPG